LNGHAVPRSNRDSDRGRFSLARVYHLAAILRAARDPAVVGSVVDVFRTGLVSCERVSSFSVLLLRRGDELRPGLLLLSNEFRNDQTDVQSL
jgi:hypothetical protein